MFRPLFFGILLVTLLVNILFLFACKDEPPDPTAASSTFGSVADSLAQTSTAARERRLFLRSNDLQDYQLIPSAPESSTQTAGPNGLLRLLKSRITAPRTQDAAGLSPTASAISLTTHPAPEDTHSRQPGAAGQTTPTVSHSTIVTTSLLAHKIVSPISQTKLVTKDNSSPTTNSRFAHAKSKVNPQDTSESAPAFRKSDKNDSQDNQQDSIRNPAIPANPAFAVNRIDPSYTQRGQTNSFGPRRLNIKVKSSKNSLVISVDNMVVHEVRSQPVDEQRIVTGKRKKSRDKSNFYGQDQVAKKSNTADDQETASQGRGIHVVVLNQFDGSVMSKRVFDTYSPNEDEELCHFINMVHDGRILVLGVKDEASFMMPPMSPARLLLRQLGSEHITKLKWRDMWAYIMRKSSPSETSQKLGQSSKQAVEQHRREVNLAEAWSRSAHFSDWAPAVILDANVELSATPSGAGNYECTWNSSDQDETARRLEFCSRVEGYGRVCDCDHPAPISFNASGLKLAELAAVPIIVMASNRPFYLYRMLRSLLTTQGVEPSMITVFIDGYYEEPLMVCRLFKLRAVQQKPEGRRSARISHHYKSSLSATFELHPEAEHAIIFEEDLDIAEDALIYFNQTLPVLRADPTLYCVSAWNDQGYEHSVGNSSLLYRIETMPGLGWLLSRKLYKQELEPNWPSPDRPHDWDMWIRTTSMRRGRECIIPDVSRTYHFGAIGTNINSYFQRQYFNQHAFNLRPLRGSDSFADLDRMESSSYELMVADVIRRSHVFGTDTFDEARLADWTQNTALAENKVCSLASFDHDSLKQPETGYNSSERPIVIYIDMIDRNDFRNWFRLAKCWRIWDLDARGQHKSMWRLHLSGRATTVVGVPASPYARFKPPNLVPLNFTTSALDTS